MSFIRVSLVWPSDPAPGRSALDERRGTSSKPQDLPPPVRSGVRSIASLITLPRSAGEFSRFRLSEEEDEDAADEWERRANTAAPRQDAVNEPRGTLTVWVPKARKPDRNEYMRQYMRARRAKQKKERVENAADLPRPGNSAE